MLSRTEELRAELMLLMREKPAARTGGVTADGAATRASEDAVQSRMRRAGDSVHRCWSTMTLVQLRESIRQARKPSFSPRSAGPPARDSLTYRSRSPPAKSRCNMY